MPNDKSEKIINWLLIALLTVGFALQLYLVYFGYKTYNFLVPPGSDAIVHFNIIKQIMTTGQINFGLYPPGFHLLVIFINKITHVGVFHILTYWTPILVVLPALCMFFLLKQLFDNKVSVLTTLIFLLASNYPMLSFMDGNYPDILAYGVFSVLLFAFIIRYLRTKNWTNLIFASIFLLLVALTHHLTFISILLILFVFGLVQLYIIIVEKKLNMKFWCWKTLASLVILVLVGLSVYLAVKFYGSTILKYANGFLSNSPALRDQYLNLVPNWPDYAQTSGSVVWYVGLLGLLYMLITTFKDRREVGTKQLVLIWFLFFFAFSRFAATGLPARFARELAPPLVICIGFLLNNVLNSNPLRIHRYKLIFGYGVVGFLIITNSVLFMGPAQIPESFGNMIWFWQKDQDKLNFISSHVPTNYQVLYNPAANLYTPIKATSNFVPLTLTKDQLQIVKTTNVVSYIYQPVSAKKAKTLTGYAKLIYDLHAQYTEPKYIFLDVKPPSNPSEVTYPHYANFDAYNKVLDDLSQSGEIVKKFPDGSRLVKMY